MNEKKDSMVIEAQIRAGLPEMKGVVVRIENDGPIVGRVVGYNPDTGMAEISLESWVKHSPLTEGLCSSPWNKPEKK